ncbi:chaperone modulator CbpM [Pleurocapsa sp. PCC 7319]|uniref:chaperone modulator CbpM n=1 Tax=Pleurocapsa sp. PCC 7319 TaxID=118161 RepID=UPI0003464E4E|nr:chaperone modulator CbpM [Pleurocapsa sp. PCC 7319]
MKPMSLSQIVVSRKGNRLITFEQAAYLTHTSVITLERFADLGLIERVESMMQLSDLTRVMQIMRLRRDLGLNLVGAAIALDMAAEISQLKAQIKAVRQQQF